LKISTEQTSQPSKTALTSKRRSWNYRMVQKSWFVLVNFTLTYMDPL